TPRELRPLMGNWIYGCDVCQDVCPFNRFAQTRNEHLFRPDHIEQAAPKLLDLLAMDQEAFAQRYAHSPIKRIKRHRLVRNACIAAGNWGSQEAVPALAALLHDEQALARGHAAWALGEIGGKQAAGALAAALPREEDEEAREELLWANQRV